MDQGLRENLKRRQEKNTHCFWYKSFGTKNTKSRLENQMSRLGNQITQGKTQNKRKWSLIQERKSRNCYYYKEGKLLEKG